MAIAAPILFMMLFAAIEFCGVNVQRHTADNAAYEASRRGIVPGATANDCIEVANRIMATVGANNVDVTVTPATIVDETETVTVNVTLPIAGNGWIAPIFFDDDDTVVAESTMLREEF